MQQHTFMMHALSILSWTDMKPSRGGTTGWMLMLMLVLVM